MLASCVACGRYTMQDTCPACGGEARDPAPPKFSPEDKYGIYRRRLRRQDEAASDETDGGSP